MNRDNKCWEVCRQKGMQAVEKIRIYMQAPWEINIELLRKLELELLYDQDIYQKDS